MGTPYIGEIRIFAGTFAPNGWAFCDGALLAISDNDALFALIGTTYGGDGQSTFALPDLQGRVPVHMGTARSGTAYTQGEAIGVETVTLTVNQLPGHTHAWGASTDTANSVSPTNNVNAASTVISQFKETGNPTATMDTDAIGQAGGNQPHSNIQPILAVNFIISLFGVFPTQN
jgi:microcystin-dependent protein